jgi:hypothetical protein
MNSFPFSVFILFATFVYSVLKPDEIKRLNFYIDEMNSLVKDTAAENKGLYNFFKYEANLNEIYCAMDLVAVFNAVNELLCLKGKGCMSEFDTTQLPIDLSSEGSPQAGYKEVTDLCHSVTTLHAEYGVGKPGFGWTFIGSAHFQRISQVLKDYSSLLKIATPGTDLYKKLNVRFQFDQLIPRLSAACLQFNGKMFPKGFYEKLEKAVLKKEFDAKYESKEKETKVIVPAETNDQDEGKQGTRLSLFPLKKKTILAFFALVLILVVIGFIIYFFIKRKL